MSKFKKASRGGFGSPAMGGGMGNMMAQVQKLQAEMEKTQAALADEVITSSVGGGMVTVTATGDQEIKSIVIQPEAVNPEDVELLQDMILAAVTEALQKAKAMEQQRMGALTGGLGLPPGLGF